MKTILSSQHINTYHLIQQISQFDFRISQLSWQFVIEVVFLTANVYLSDGEMIKQYNKLIEFPHSSFFN